MAKVIMNSVELVQRLETLAARKTFYKNKYPYNLCYINTDGRTSADCSNLYKALLNGYDVTKTTVGYYQKNLSNTGDCTESGLINQCSDVSTDFKKLKEGEPRLLYMKGHIGGYIGKTVVRNGKSYNVIEATPSFGNGIVYSWVDPDGLRRACKGGNQNGRWTKNGLMTPWVSYVGQSPTPSPKPAPAQDTTPTVPKFNANEMPTIKKGSKGDAVKTLQNCLVYLGYDPKGIDGQFGPGCETAVMKFQADNKLTKDGIVGQKTWRKLKEKVDEKSSSSKPSISETPGFKSYSVVITASVLNIRKGPGTNYAVIGSFKKNDICKIIEEKNGWGKVDSKNGWISLSYTKKK